MNLTTNLHGRIRNTSLPYTHALMPLFEAVVNSIHSIEENGNLGSGAISVEIIRNGQADFFDDSLSESAILGFKITDNGIGFNDKNMLSFETLDSEHKVEKGCRGVGRLLWLKAFSKISIRSNFQENEKCLFREFEFNDVHGVSESKTSGSDGKSRKTVVYLQNFKEKYRKASHKTIEKISNVMLEHCLWYFVRDSGVPTIEITDGKERIELNELYDVYMQSSAKHEQVEIKGEKFDLTHLKFRASSSRNHSMALCAASRLVKEQNITGKIPGLFGKIDDGNGEFVYSCYVSSPFLDQRVRAERTGFDIDEKIEDMFSSTEISITDIREIVFEKVTLFLGDVLKENITAGKDRIDKFISNVAPKYRPIIKRVPEDALAVDPNITDKELDLVLHKQLVEIEQQLLSEGHDVMEPKKGESSEDYQARLYEYLSVAEDVKKSDLASYVSHRRVILDLLEKAIQRDDKGKYVKEELIHELIMPMQKDSNEVALADCNLWLVDERLAFHNYLASDKTLNSMPITGDKSTKEPDLCALNICDNPMLVAEGSRLPLASIEVIEIKRPMRNDARKGEEKDPIEQALNYLDRIRNGKVKTASGRPIPNSQDIPGYCYIICDLTDSVKKRCQMADLTVTSDHLGYFGYNKYYKAYIEVISFDRLVNAAKERNRAFFDKLGLPSN